MRNGDDRTLENTGIGVVIIDDSELWLHRFESAIREIGSLAVLGSAGSQAEAIELVSRLRPPILILDLALSDGNGVDVLKTLSSKGIGTRVVVVTGSPCTRIRAACLRLGARYFFDKAFEFEDLQAALRALAEEVRAA